MPEHADSSPQAVVTAFFARLKSHDLEEMLMLFHDDAVDDFVVVGEFRGKSAIRGFFSDLFSAFPDFDIAVVHMTGDDARAVVQWHATGTFTGTPFQGIHPTGRGVHLRGCDVFRVEDGKLRHGTIYYDGLSFARQIGLLPREGSAADKAMTAAFNATTDIRARLHRNPEPARAG
jgi:steroid delta-isomerase-like uncharacterized protein